MKVTIQHFQDSALAMVADLERSHEISFTPKESMALCEVMAEHAQRHWWNSKQGNKYLIECENERASKPKASQ